MTALEPINDIDILPMQRPAHSGAIGQLMAHAQAMTTAKQLADALCQTEMVPARYRGKPGDAAAAILYGAEIGLNPIQSLQNIFAVHGQPSIYARTAVALVKRAGIRVSTVESTDQSVTVSASNPATGEVEVSTWDIARAEVAGYTANKKYKTNPQEMLWSKAAMEVCRKIAPDVLMGIPYAREELELETVQSSRPPIVSSRRGVDGLRAAIATAPVIEPEIVGDDEDDDDDQAPAAVEPIKGMAPATRAKWVKRLDQLLTDGGADEAEWMVLVKEFLVLDALPDSVEVLSDDELRDIVNLLNALGKDGTLADRINDILSAEALRLEGV
jgi:hypothetical protein